MGGTQISLSRVLRGRCARTIPQLSLVPPLSTRMAALHSDREAAGFKAVFLCHCTVMGGEGKEILCCLALSDLLGVLPKHPWNKKQEHLWLFGLVPCLPRDRPMVQIAPDQYACLMSLPNAVASASKGTPACAVGLAHGPASASCGGGRRHIRTHCHTPSR